MSEHTTIWQKIEAWWHLLWHHAQAGTLPDAPAAGGVPVTIPPVGGTVTPPAPPLPPPGPVLPTGIIGQPNADRLVQVQAVEDARAKGLADADPIIVAWAKYLPQWWGVDEVARLYPTDDAAAQAVIRACNASMLNGALIGNGFNSKNWHVWQATGRVQYASPIEAAVVAGPNNFGPLAQTGFPGIKIADFPALLEANRQLALSKGAPFDPNAPWVAGPGHSGGGAFK